jgi:hypothetical protein
MQRERGHRVRTNEERARALGIGVAIILLCFTAGLFMSLRGIGMDIGPAPAPADGVVEPRTVDGVATYVHLDHGGRAVACSSTYSSSNCATVAVVIARHRPAK